MRSDKEMLDWLADKTEAHKVYLDGVGWIRLTREEISKEIEIQIDAGEWESRMEVKR